MFDFNPFEVGNPMTLGMIEEELVSEIRRMANASQIGYIIYTRDVYALLGRYHVRYDNLPQWIKDEIDKINLSD